MRASSTAEDPRALLDLCAGWAVGRGALHAGKLSKRSDWLREWNSRFFVLTCEEITWFPSAHTEQVTCASWRFAATGERRTIAVESSLSVTPKGDTLVVTGITGRVVVRAASPAELEAWQSALSALLLSLRQDASVARLYIRERASLFSSYAFSEHPHAGSRPRL